MKSNRPKAEAIVQIDNDRVIITKWTFSSGAETGWHKHGYDYIVVPCRAGKLLIETTVSENITELEVGKSYYRSGGVEHNVVNANNDEFSFVEIELK